MLFVNQFTVTPPPNAEAVEEAVSLFAGETKKLVTMRKLRVLPVGAGVLSDSWDLPLRRQAYQADAVQVATARQIGAGMLLSADRRLLDFAKSEVLQTANPERDRELIGTLLEPKEES